MLNKKRQEEIVKPYALSPYPVCIYIATSKEEVRFITETLEKRYKAEKGYFNFLVDTFPDIAAIYHHDCPDGSEVILAAFNKDNYKEFTLDKIIGFAAHEATHVVQQVQRVIYGNEERSLDPESQAYLLQYVLHIFLSELGYDKVINKKQLTNNKKSVK